MLIIITIVIIIINKVMPGARERREIRPGL